MPEQRSANVPMNDYRPTDADLHYFRTVRNPAGQTSVKFNHWNAYVDGRSYLRNPSTDDLIQSATHKWGIPEDWIRAQAAFEARWHIDLNADLACVPTKWARMCPAFAHSIEGPNWV
jgi:hypothetical protein